MPHWIHSVVHWAPWALVPGFLAGAAKVWQFWSARKAARARQIEEDEATWRIEWKNVMVPVPGRDKGHYDLVNESSAAKYSVAVQSPAGTDRWEVIYEGKSEPLANSFAPQKDQPTKRTEFTVSWRATQAKKKPHTVTVWGQNPS
jgi:hypothetical protein